MRYLIFFLASILSLSICAQSFKPDILTGFEQCTIQQSDDYDGKVVCTIVRKVKEGNRKAVLYVHGFSDYFFQTALAEQYLLNGFDFYAVDLRKYGRSHLPNQRFFDVRSIHEYDADLDTTLKLIQHFGYNKVLLSGHSTGGLVIACYAHAHPHTTLFNAVYLNSPFFDMNLSKLMEKVVVPFGSAIGSVLPRAKAGPSLPPFYGYAIHQAYFGEWTFDTIWKPIRVPSVNFGWTRAIHRAHREVQRNNCFQSIPVLIQRSNHSVYGKSWSDAFTKGDAVLDVNDIQRYGMQSGSQVTIQVIPDALHDMTLSKQPVRSESYQRLFEWLHQIWP